MKKFLFVFVCLFVCFGLFSAEDLAAGTTLGPTTVVETTESWKAIAGTIFTVFVGALSALAVGLVNLILALVSKKYNIQVDEAIKSKLEGAVITGIKAAEAWARNQTVKPTSSDKLNYALGVVRTVAGISIVNRFVNEDLIKLIESKLFEGVTLEGSPVTKGFTGMIQSKGAKRVG